MKTLYRNVAAIAVAGALSACGGGGQTTTALPTSTTTTPNSTSSNRTPLGTATLTLKFSSNFHTAKGAHRTSTTASRKPAYVNSNAYYLDVWVISGGVATHAVNSTGASNVNSAPPGTQSFQIPIFSTSNSQIVAYETDQQFQGGGNLLAIGEADLASFTPGTPVQLSLTMLMNAQYIGVMSDPDNLNGDAVVGPTSYTNNFNGSYYFFAADPAAGFVDAAGTGGVSPPVIASTVDNSGSTGALVQASGVNAGYSVNSGVVCSGGFTVGLTAGNPAYAVANDAYYNLGTFPGIDYLYQNPGSTDVWFGTYVYGVFSRGATFSTNIGITYDFC